MKRTVKEAHTPTKPSSQREPLRLRVETLRSITGGDRPLGPWLPPQDWTMPW